MASTTKTKDSTNTAAALTAPFDIIASAAEKWNSTYPKRTVAPSLRHAEESLGLTLVSLPVWPGVGNVRTSADIVPLVTLAGMPAGKYFENTRAFGMYSAAEMCTRHPELTLQGAHTELIRVVSVVAAVRGATWKVIGATPIASEGVSSVAVRWSARHGKLVVREAGSTAGANMWRHFLATSPGCPVALEEFMDTLSGLAPMLFLYGASLNLSDGDLLSTHFLEREMDNYARAHMTVRGHASMGLCHVSSWELMGAAAVSGYSASVIKHISSDSAFVTAAQMSISPDNTDGLRTRLGKILSAADGGGSKMSTLGPSDAPLFAHSWGVRVDLSDSVSVADTEDTFVKEESPEPSVTRVDEYLKHLRMFPAPTVGDDNGEEGTSRTPVPMKPGEVSDIRDAARMLQQLGNVCPSMARDADPDESAMF
jgi:hypothetical protein